MAGCNWIVRWLPKFADDVDPLTWLSHLHTEACGTSDEGMTEPTQRDPIRPVIKPVPNPRHLSRCHVLPSQLCPLNFGFSAVNLDYAPPYWSCPFHVHLIDNLTPWGSFLQLHSSSFIFYSPPLVQPSHRRHHDLASSAHHPDSINVYNCCEPPTVFGVVCIHFGALTFRARAFCLLHSSHHPMYIASLYLASYLPFLSPCGRFSQKREIFFSPRMLVYLTTSWLSQFASIRRGNE